MNKTDSITKNFLNGNGQFNPSPFKNLNIDISLSENGLGVGVSSGVDKWIENEDPTYLGFWVYLQPELAILGANDNYNRDYLPQGLLIPDNLSTSEQAQQQQSDSVVGYFRRRNEHYRAKMMEEFQAGFTKIFKKTPWMIQKISGVDGLWKINPSNNYRTKDVVLTFECLETIDLKMTYILDLYRKSIWDATYHRWAAPDCQRYFMMDIVIAEIRTMQRPGLLGPYNLGTFHTFRCEYCELDPFSDDVGYLGNLNRFADGTPASVKFKVKVGAVREINKYGLLGAYLQDTKYAFERGKTFRDSSFASDGGDKVLRSFSDYFSALGGAQYLINAAENVARSAVNKLLLGNVYGFSPSNAINALQSAINNPEAAARSLFSNAGVASPIADALSSNIQLTGAEIELIKDTIGSVEILANAVTGTDLENQSIETIINTIASENLQRTSLGNISLNSTQTPPMSGDSVTLNAPNKNNTLDSVRLVLENNGSSLQGNLDKVLFVAPTKNVGLPSNIQLSGTPTENSLQAPKVELTSPVSSDTVPEKVELTSAESSSTAGGQVELVSPSINNDIETSVTLEEPPVNTNSETKVKLLSFPIKPSSDSKVELEGNFESSPIESSVDLVSPPKGGLETAKVDLVAPETAQAKPLTVEFDDPPKANIGLDKVGLIAPITPSADNEQVDLIAPTINTNIEKNINFSGVDDSIIADNLGKTILE
jgi:hypothetical protein